MEMKINSAALRHLRTKKLWSQQELAIATGLSLRTVQRMESEGSASMESVKALAATLEVGTEQLLMPAQTESTYLHVQLGLVIIAMVIVVTVLATWQFERGSISFSAFITLTAIMAAIAALFSTLTVRVDSNSVSWNFSLGFWRKSLPLDRVEKAEVVRNRAWWGIGIRHYGAGWLYCVSGLSAVELKLSDGSQVRIGSDEPEALHQAILQASPSLVLDN